MTGLDQFLETFGNITISQVVMVVLSIVFVVLVYKKFRDYLIKKHEIEKERDVEIKECLTAVRKYPEYRQQSIKIQELLEGEIQELRSMQQENTERLLRMEEQDKRRECNKLRDMLLQNYRYYTNKERNPSQSWSKMEAEAFWELFRDYEELGGDGYMHTEVQPAMQRLAVTEFGK